MAKSDIMQRWRERKAKGQSLPMCPCCQKRKLRIDSKGGLCSSCYRQTDEYKKMERERIRQLRERQRQGK